MNRASRHRGIGALLKALAPTGPTRALPARLSSAASGAVIAAGLPAPSMNFNVAGFEVDAYWEAERFAVELDVYETHGGRAAFERDRLRQEELKLAGIEMIRITGVDSIASRRGWRSDWPTLAQRRRAASGRPGGGAR